MRRALQIINPYQRLMGGSFIESHTNVKMFGQSGGTRYYSHLSLHFNLSCPT